MFERTRILCFDLDNTLWDVWPVIARAERAVYDWLSENHPCVASRYSIEELRAARISLARAEPSLAHDVTALRVESLARIAREVGAPETLGHDAFEVFYAVRNAVTLYDDVLPALSRLGRHFRLASFSNGNADLRRIGLAQYFELSLTAGDTGVAKPDARAFAAVLARLGSRAEEVVYIGDDPQADVVGARDAGLRTVWVNRGVMSWPLTLPAADLEVSDLKELVSTAGCTGDALTNAEHHR